MHQPMQGARHPRQTGERRPSLYEAEKMLKEVKPWFRAYDWREIERMRESEAHLGGIVGSFGPALVRVAKSCEDIERLMESARQAKDYKTSDSLREILDDLAYPRRCGLNYHSHWSKVWLKVEDQGGG